MGNAFSSLKSHVTSLPPNTPWPSVQASAQAHIAEYVEKVRLATAAVGRLGAEKVRPGSAVLTYGCSSAAVEVFRHAALVESKSFEVWVVDCGPFWPGRRCVSALSDLPGVRLHYVSYSGLSYAMQRVSLVLCGCSALLSNGHVLAAAGTQGVAMVARKKRIPVLALCETYKFSKKVQLDAFTWNELLPSSSSSPPDDVKGLGVRYDVTREVEGVVCEMGYVPGTSVAVILREME